MMNNTAARMNRCSCGKRVSRHATVCGACHQAKMDRLHAEASASVATGKCPDCGSPLVRNLALTGWWQCAGYAAEGFRRPGFEDLPKCSFQTFTA